jgi:hypothetical protein
MADKKIKLVVGEQEVTCNFGVNYFYKHFQEASGIDMLVDGLKGIQTTKIFDVLPAIYFAGYKAECSINMQEVKLTKDQFEHHVLSADESTAGQMLKDYLSAIKPVESEGELAAQMQTG